MSLKKPLLIFSSIVIIFVIFLSQFNYRTYAYNHADWLIKRKILEVFKLYSDQQDKLKTTLKDYMNWHRSVMLPEYIGLLAQMDDRIRALELDKLKFTPEEMDEWVLKIRKLYVDTASKLGLDIIPILTQMNESQVDRTRTLLDRRLQQWRDLKEISKKALMEDLLYSWQGNFEHLFDELSVDQNKIIERTIFRLYIPPSYQLAYEGRLNQKILSGLEKIEEESRESAQEELKGVLSYWIKESDHTLWRVELSKLMAKVFNLADTQQVKGLRVKILKWRELMVKLSSQ